MQLSRTEKGDSAFKNQRVTAVMLVFLLLFFAWHIIKYHNAPRQEWVTWLHSPAIASIMILTMAAAFYHSFLGLKMVVEDYVHCKNLKRLSVFLLTLIHMFLALLCIVLIILL